MPMRRLTQTLPSTGSSDRCNQVILPQSHGVASRSNMAAGNARHYVHFHGIDQLGTLPPGLLDAEFVQFGSFTKVRQMWYDI